MKKKILLTVSILWFFLLFVFLIRLVLTPRAVFDVENPLRDLRALITSLITYHNDYNSFPPDLRSLGPPPSGVAPSANAADLISNKLASGSGAGYRFTYRPFSSKRKGPFDRFTVNADPIDVCSKECRHFFVDELGVIHVEANSPATAESPEL